MSVQKYLQMREKWLKKFVKFLNPDADEIRGAYDNLRRIRKGTIDGIA